MKSDAETFYAHRVRFNELLAQGKSSTQEAAEIFYYLNRTCYNGLCRFNQSGLFNVPFGQYTAIEYRTDFEQYREVLGDWDFRCGDFEDISLKSDDFVYADPPYDVQFTSYAKQRFTWEEQKRAAQWLAKHPGPVVLSNQATPRVLDLYKRLDFALKYLPAPRMISCTGDRTRAQEVLATRNVAQPGATLGQG